MIKKISDKDKQDWNDFITNKEKTFNKDFYLDKKIPQKLVKKIDLHGFTLENANKEIEKFINKFYENKISKIIVITGKGLRSNNISNPYVSKDLSILKYSVPEFIRSNKNLMSMIKEIKDAKIEDGGSGAFYIYLKNKY